jgi:hypothetical protein
MISNGRVPRIQFSPGGGILDAKLAKPKPRIPQAPVACKSKLREGGLGLRDPEFRTCFLEHLQKKVQPLFAKARASIGKQADMNSLCTQTSLAPHQVVVYEIAKLMAVVPPERLGEHRGLLTWASTGSGKTVTSLAIIMAFWPSQKRIYLVSSKSNTDQAIASYKREAIRFFPSEVKTIANEFRRRRGAANLSDTAAFGAALMERVVGLTFRMARNRLAPARANEFKTIKVAPLWEDGGSVMIVDEAQGLAMRDKTDPMGDAIKLGCAMRAMSKEKMRKINVFAMTATPGNTIKQWLKLLSIVRRADQLPFTLDNDAGTNKQGAAMCRQVVQPGARDDAKALEGLLKVAIEAPNSPEAQKALQAIVAYVRRNFFGLVSYVDIRSDMSRHACVEEVTKMIPMDKEYFLLLLRQNADDRKTFKTQVDRLQHEYDSRYPNAFALKMRRFGNVLPKTIFDKMSPQTIRAMRDNRRLIKSAQGHDNLISPKFALLAQFIMDKPGKHYVYMVAPNADTLGRALTLWSDPGRKMVNVTKMADAFDKAHVKNGKIVGMTRNPTKNNFIVIGDTTEKSHRERLVDIFNSPQNADGSFARVVIVSGQLYEGLDLKALRYVSLGDVLASPLQESQAIGRGVRNCSHQGLPMVDRKVTIVRWFSSAPRGGWDALQPSLAGMKGFGPRSRTGHADIEEEYRRMEGRSYDEMVFARSRKDPEYMLLSNFERVMKTAALDCAVLAPFHPGSSCTVAKLSRSVSLTAGTRCA